MNLNCVVDEPTNSVCRLVCAVELRYYYCHYWGEKYRLKLKMKAFLTHLNQSLGGDADLIIEDGGDDDSVSDVRGSETKKFRTILPPGVNLKSEDDEDEKSFSRNSGRFSSRVSSTTAGLLTQL